MDPAAPRATDADSPIVDGPNPVEPPVFISPYTLPIRPPELTEDQLNQVNRVGNRNMRGEIRRSESPGSEKATPLTQTSLMADPDTIPTGTQYVTYATNGNAPGCSSNIFRHVPMIVHGSGETIDLGNKCPQFDAMPNGPGSWAYQGPCAQMWAPTVIQNGSRFILYYAASKAGTGAGCRPGQLGQMCIGKAYSSAPYGFVDAGEFACPRQQPSGDRPWAIDPDAYYNESGTVFVVYRDDNARSSAGQTAIATVPTDSNGTGQWNYWKKLYDSATISWDNLVGDDIIENPSMFKIASNSSWYLFFSGSDWATANYATGVANCGGTTSPPNTCPIVSGTTNRPYFGFSPGLNPQKTLPNNYPGPGGMSLFKTNSGAARVVWHIYYLGGRPSLAGTLAYASASGFTIT